MSVITRYDHECVDYRHCEWCRDRRSEAKLLQCPICWNSGTQLRGIPGGEHLFQCGGCGWVDPYGYVVKPKEKR